MDCFGARWTATPKASLEWTCLCTKMKERLKVSVNHITKSEGLWYHGPQWTCLCTMRNPFKTVPDENYHHKCTSKFLKSWNVRELPCKTQPETIPDLRKVWELSRKTHIEEVEEPETTRITTQSCPHPSIRPSQNTEEHENYHKKCTSKSRRSWKTGNTTRIAKPNPDPTTAATPKARVLPRKMKSKHESTRITANPVRNLRCNPAFSLSIRTLSVKHTVWGTMTKRFHVI